MSRTDGIAAHLLQYLDLADEGGFVDGSTQRTKVMMQADAFYLTCHSVQLETVLFRHTDSTNTHVNGLFVKGGVAGCQPCHHLI